MEILVVAVGSVLLARSHGYRIAPFNQPQDRNYHGNKARSRGGSSIIEAQAPRAGSAPKQPERGPVSKPPKATWVRRVTEAMSLHAKEMLSAKSLGMSVPTSSRRKALSSGQKALSKTKTIQGQGSLEQHPHSQRVRPQRGQQQRGQQQADTFQNANASISSAAAAALGPHLVLTDVDDTIKSSGGKIGHLKGRLAGSDRAYYPGEVYPGVAQFSLELSRGRAQALAPPLVVVLSARPASLRHFGLKLREQGPVNTHYRGIGVANQINTTAKYPGWGIDVEGSQYGVLHDSTKSFNGGMGKTKYKGWKAVSKNTTLGTIFIGDDGQGDVYAAKLMFAHSKPTGSRLLAAFIHLVKADGRPAGVSRKIAPDKPIFYFETYADAAAHAYREQLISSSGLDRVLHSISQNSFFKLCCMRENKCHASDNYRCNKCAISAPQTIPHWVKESNLYEVCCDGRPPTDRQVRSILGTLGTRCASLMRSWKKARDFRLKEKPKLHYKSLDGASACCQASAGREWTKKLGKAEKAEEAWKNAAMKAGKKAGEEVSKAAREQKRRDRDLLKKLRRPSAL